MTNNECGHLSSEFMAADNVNLTFEATFNFIKTHQVDKDGKLRGSNIYTSAALLENQGTLILTPRKNAVNLIYGMVVDVTPTYVVILSEVLCDTETKFEQYTISYNTIINLINPVLETYTKEYINTIEKLPQISPAPNETAYDMLKAFKVALAKNIPDPDKLVYVIYDGMSSLAYVPEGIKVLRNFIYTYSQSIIPITMMDGFFFKDKFHEINKIMLEGDGYEQNLQSLFESK